MGTAGLRIEPFAQADLPTWQAMLRAYLLEHDPHSNPAQYWDREFFDACLAGLAAGTHLIWLARKDDEAVGFSLARLEPAWYRRSIRMGTVEEFYVAPAHRRAGIGRALATRTIAALRAGGATSISASVLQANLGALLFWQRMGFSIEAYHLFLRT
jgi:ribosomal protein S18 acetylase RimI-like enzyme